jgi:AbrB family looped-hinge helix DNA binding protein
MNLPLFTQTNKKGQIVIPKKARDKLGITEGTVLQIVIGDQSVQLYPLKTHSKFSKESYLKILRTTAGVWGPMTLKEITEEKERHKFEQQVTIKNKSAW